MVERIVATMTSHRLWLLSGIRVGRDKERARGERESPRTFFRVTSPFTRSRLECPILKRSRLHVNPSHIIELFL